MSVSETRNCSPWRSLRTFSICTSSFALFSGRRIIRDFSQMAFRMAWRIHHTAYEMKWYPFSTSNRSMAFMSPMFPSLIRSARGRPWFWYFFATLTTNRRFARISFSFAEIVVLCRPACAAFPLPPS